jgi:hypothetical protein
MTRIRILAAATAFAARKIGTHAASGRRTVLPIRILQLSPAARLHDAASRKIRLAVASVGA